MLKALRAIDGSRTSAAVLDIARELLSGKEAEVMRNKRTPHQRLDAVFERMAEAMIVHDRGMGRSRR
jgi:hypothetical protein